VGNEFLITRSARARRHPGRLAASPMRPLIGDIAGKLSTRAERYAEAQNRHRREETLDPDGHGVQRRSPKSQTEVATPF
jgi:hypothetical protein